MSRILADDVVDALESDHEISPELSRMMKRAREASDFLKALAHENRLLLLCLLAERERSVTELEELLSLRQTTVSQQLARLRLGEATDEGVALTPAEEDGEPAPPPDPGRGRASVAGVPPGRPVLPCRARRVRAGAAFDDLPLRRADPAGALPPGRARRGATRLR